MSERVVAVVGCGFVGSTVARLAAEAGATVLAIDKSPRPYGELESQVPSWLAATVGGLVGRIDENLAHENVVFVPRTEVGIDVSRDTLEGLGALVETTGRLSVRRVPLPTHSAVISHSQLVAWFNRRGHPAFPGPAIGLPTQVAVVGDGLAAVDAARLLSLELHQRALLAKGHLIGIESLWYQGVRPAVRKLGVTELPSVTLVVPGGREALLADAPMESRAQTLENLEQRDGVMLLPGFEVVSFLESGERLSGLSLVNPRAEGFSMSLSCGLVVDAREELAKDPLDVMSRLPGALVERLWEARLIPARSEEAAIARGASLGESLGEAVAELVAPVVAKAIAKSPSDTRERALTWARERHLAVGYTDYVDWIGETRRTWLYQSGGGR